MCTVDCPLCDRPVPFGPGDDVFDCPTCAVSTWVVDDEPLRLAAAA